VRASALGLALLFALTTPLGASAQYRRDTARGGAAARPAPRAAIPAPRPLAPRRLGGGFDLNNDVASSAQHPAKPVYASGPPAGNRYLPAGVAENHTVVDNPTHHGQQPWAWNHGITWFAAPIYWGGGFWGPYALDESANAPVVPDSPGATLLSNYQLTQTPCDSSDLVIIFGPDDSMICAYPTDQVPSGQYDIDPSNLTLVSRS
jgi:hypothetical protein